MEFRRVLFRSATGRQFRPSWCFLRETFARLRKPPIAGEKCGKHVGHKFGQWFRLPIGVIVDNNIVRERAVKVRWHHDRQFDWRTIRRSEEHTSELQSLMRISYAVFCLKKKKHTHLLTTKNRSTQEQQNNN